MVFYRRAFGRAFAFTAASGCAFALAPKAQTWNTEEGNGTLLESVLRRFQSISSKFMERNESDSAIANANVAHCRQRLDTPEYLVPYYLRSNLSRFTYYASKKKNGSKFKRMNEEEFLQALLGRDKNKEVTNPGAASDLFKQFDTNGDGEISFREFSFMLTLLATPRDQFITAFQMFDRGNVNIDTGASADPMKASLNFEEFCEFIETKGDEYARPKINNLLMKKLFGEAGNKRCNAENMLSEVDAFKKKVWRAEYLQHVDEKIVEKAKSDDEFKIPSEAVGTLVYDHLVGRHLPFSFVKSLRTLKKQDEAAGEGGGISLESWYTLSRLTENAEKIGAAVRLYSQTAGKELNRKQFSRAVRCCDDPNLKLTEKEIDLLFVLFDTDGSNTISFDEFEKLAESRRTFHVKSAIEEKGDTREYFVPRLIKCTSDALFSE